MLVTLVEKACSSSFLEIAALEFVGGMANLLQAHLRGVSFFVALRLFQRQLAIEPVNRSDVGLCSADCASAGSMLATLVQFPRDFPKSRNCFEGYSKLLGQ